MVTGDVFASWECDLPLTLYLNQEVNVFLEYLGGKHLRNRPRGNALELKLCDITDTNIFSFINRNYGGRFSNINPNRPLKWIQRSLFAARRISDCLNADKVRSNGSKYV